MKRILYILLGLWAGYAAYPQPTPEENRERGDMRETIVIGDVYDAYTGNPLPNVNIYFQGTTLGTKSNPDGMFLLRGMINRPRTMIVSAVGYQTERFHIEAGQQFGIEVALKEKVGNLSDVFVFPGANPALPLLEQVRKHRHANQRQIETENAKIQTALYVSDIQSKHLQRSLWKSLQAGMLQSEDSSYLIPLYWCKKEAQQTEEKSTLLTTTDYQVLLSQLQNTCDFYDNNVNVLSMSLLSPLAASGNTYYNYFLADSTLVDNEKHYIVHFKTKNSFYATFNGEMYIDSATYALRSIRAIVPSQTSINYLRQLVINQSFDTSNQLKEEDLSLLLDFAIKTDTTHFFPTLLITRSTEIPIASSPPPSHTLMGLAENMSISSAMDSVGNTPIFKTAKFLAYIINTGNIPTSKYVEIGKLHHVFRYNRQEGVRVGIPLQTTAELWKNVSLEGFLAYGCGDHAWKGMGQVNIALPTQRRHILRIRYRDEYDLSDVSDFQLYLRENNILCPQINIITRLMQGLPANGDMYFNTMLRRQEGRIHFEDDWNNYLETQSYIKIGRMGYGIPTRDYYGQPSFTYATLGASARISFNERKIDSYFHRRHSYNHLPVIYVGGEVGSYQTAEMSSYRMYGNLQLMVRQQVDLGVGGSLDYLLQTGMIFGRVPYPLLHIFAGNPSYALDPHRFSLMNTYQYAADYYVSLQTLWNGNGLLFNLIPGVRYLRLRELLELKVAYGGMRNNHQSVVPFPIASSPNSLIASSPYCPLSSMSVPYIELGVGIGNILRIGEVYAVFRLTNIHDPYIPWWGIRFRLSMGL
ncbi:MAG: carboxypeptidase-like regulatory domain-containing protein [Paludibacteraceae bacterium]|nr:carboxypeptidase-like regulatory domain-containing protein [Paludibacteraceae bacterium]